MQKRQIPLFFRSLAFLSLALLATGAAAVVQDRPVLSINIPTIQLTNYTVVNDASGVRTIDIPWIAQYATGVYSYAVSIAAILAGVMFVVGGFQYLTAGGDASRVSKAKERIKDAIIGLFLTFGAYAILITINPFLVSNPDIRIQTLKRISFPSNETTLAPGQPGSTVTSGTTLPPGTVPTGGGAADGLNGVPFYGQCNSPNSTTPYLDQAGRCHCETPGGVCTGAMRPRTICTSGCGVTSAAMVVAFYHPEMRSRNLPGEVASMASRNGFRGCAADCSNCGGTSPALFSSAAMQQNYGMTAEAVRGREAALTQLRAGHPIVAVGMVPCGASTCGHFYVLAGVNSDGTIAINDPNSPSAGHNFWGLDTAHVPADRVFGYTSGMWYLHPTGQ